MIQVDLNTYSAADAWLDNGYIRLVQHSNNIENKGDMTRSMGDWVTILDRMKLTRSEVVL